MMDRRTLLTAAALLPLAGCATARGRDGAVLRIATFNIWHDAGNWTARLPLLTAALRRADADVILLQEVLQDARKGLPNQADTLAAALDGYTAHFSTVAAEGAPSRFGNAILSRLPVTEISMRKLEPLVDSRTAIRTRVALGRRAVDVVCTHLAWRPDQQPMRARQVADVIGFLPTDGAPLVVGGDFNAPLTEASLAPLAARGLESALAPGAAATTLNTARGHAPRVIDHIFFERRAFVASDARVFGDREQAGEYPSDHFGVAATLRLL